MASLLDEIGLFDRPEIKYSLKVGKKTVDVIAHNPSALEQDAIEAFEANEYGRLLVEYTKTVDGKMSEKERIAAIYSTRPVSDLITQLLPSRAAERDTRALEIAGFDMGYEALKMSEMSENEKAEYAKEQEARLTDARKVAEDQLREEMMAEAKEDILNRLVELSINVKAQQIARNATNAHYLYFTLFDPKDGSHAFSSVDAIRKSLTAQTIDRIAREIRSALIPEPDAPFVSADDQELDKPGSSPKPVGEVSKPSGDSTEATPSS